MSIGVAEINAGDDLDSWIHRADDAMYAAKAAGRDSIQVSEWKPAGPCCPMPNVWRTSQRRLGHDCGLMEV